MTLKSPPSGLRLLRREFAPVRASAVTAFVVMLAGIVATLAGPLVIQLFINEASGRASRHVLVTYALVYFAAASLGTCARVSSGYLAARVGWHVADGLRLRLLRSATIERPVLEIEGRQVGAVLEEVEGNADIVGRAIAEAGFRCVANVLTAVGIVVVIALVVPLAGAGIALLTVLMFFGFSRLTRRAARCWETARKQQTEFFGWIGDSVAARDDLIPLGRSAWALDQSATRLESLFRTENRAYMAGRALWPFAQLFFALGLGLALGSGLHSLGHAGATAGTLTMLYLYVNLLQDPLEEVSSQAGQLQQMMAVCTIAAGVLDRTGTRTLPEGGSRTIPDTATHTTAPEVCFKNVTFGYGNGDVLHNVSFTVPAGASLGIVGPTGAGKSSIVNLLCGLATPQRGRITLGGVDISTLSQAVLAEHITVLSQQAHLFTASLAQNITLFDEDVPLERIWTVLERLGVAGWIRALPDGLATRVGSGGRTLSAGEVQIIVGARALLAPRGLLIIDEGTSRLDPETERIWSTVVSVLQCDRTVVMVAHRLGTLRDVDLILAMEEGRVADLTPPSALHDPEVAGVAR